MPLKFYRPPTSPFFFIAVAFLFLCPRCTSAQKHNLSHQKSLQPLISAIYQYQKQNNAWPDSLEQLVPRYIAADELPVFSYGYKLHGKHFLLYVPVQTGLFKQPGMYDVYWSKTKEWGLSDFTDWPLE